MWSRKSPDIYDMTGELIYPQIFCFPCILHYLSTSDNLKWMRCPICFDSVNERQLKPVKWFDGSSFAITEEEGFGSNPKGEGSSSSTVGLDNAAAPKVGSALRMRLMQRPQITTLALPRSSTWPSDLLPPHQAPFHFLPDVYDYAKFMLATPEYLIADLTHDLDELDTERRMLSGMNDSLGVGFVDASVERIKRQIAYAEALEMDPSVKMAMIKAHRELQDALKRDVKTQQRKRDIVDAPPTEEGAPDAYIASPSSLPTPSQPASSGRNSRQRKNLNPPPPSGSSFYYYQAVSGLPIFLHPLDIRILLAHFSAYASFPDVVTVRIDAFSEGSVDDDLRKRCKYLGHLPEGTDVVFIEADLESIVGHEGLKAFEGALKSRRARRREKEKRDERASKRAEERIRERETAIVRSNSGWSGSWSAAAPVGGDAGIGAQHYPYERAETPVEEPALSSTPPSAPVSGAWGSRSFASTARSAPTNANGGGRAAQRPTLNVDDDWDVDEAWHEIEQRAAGGGPGGRKKRTARMVVLGGGSGGRRR
jgi:hypothetical protein